MANPTRSKSRGTVNSFLNEKIRTATDLDNLDVLMRNLQDQQELQKQQVSILAVPMMVLRRDRMLTTYLLAADSYAKQKRSSGMRQRPRTIMQKQFITRRKRSKRGRKI